MTVTVRAGSPISKPSAPWPTDGSASCTAACATEPATTSSPPGLHPNNALVDTHRPWDVYGSGGWCSSSAEPSSTDAGSCRISTSSRPSDWMRSTRPWPRRAQRAFSDGGDSPEVTPWKGIGRLRGLSAARPSREGIVGGTIDAAAPPFPHSSLANSSPTVICRVRSTRQAPVRMRRPGDRLLPALARRPTRRCYGFASGRLQRSSAGPGRPTKFTKDRHRADLSCLAAFAAAST
jgi:hypothetical protein